VRGAGRGDLLPPGLLGEHPQPPRHGPVRSRHHPGFLQHPQRVELADRLDDPREHQLAEHFIAACCRGQAEHVIAAGQRIQEAAHLRGDDRQRPARRPRIKSQVELALPGGELLPCSRLQQLHLSWGMRRAQMLDVPRPAMGGVHDLHGCRA
jgi:hypothetical protein